MRVFVLLLAGCGLLLGTAVAEDKKKPEETETLRSYADKLGFRIGSGVRPKSWDADEDGRRILASEFNSTIEMGMMNVTQPEKGHFEFSRIDRIMKFAKEHDMKIWGSALIYRAGDLPDWVKEKRPWNAAELDKIMKEQIQTVVKHGGDTFFAWGVVNEPLSNRNQPWKMVFGDEEYIAKAFKYAREATSSELVLNETFGLSGVDRGRTDDFFKLLKAAKAIGAPIDGAGIEMHLEIPQLRPTYIDEFKYWLAQAKAAGVHVYITEMDVYQGPETPTAFEDQKKIYHDVAATCLADSNCKGLTIWDLSDKDTWLARKQMNPHPDAKPVLFDGGYKKKPAYYGVLDALRERAKAN